MAGEKRQSGFEILVRHPGRGLFPVEHDDVPLSIPEDIEKLSVVNLRSLHPGLPRSALRRHDAADSLVPALVIKPLLQGLKSDLGISLSERADVRLKAGVIEPIEHLEILFVRGDRHLDELDRLAEHAAEDLGSLRIRQIADGDLQLQTDEVLRALKRKRH